MIDLKKYSEYVLIGVFVVMLYFAGRMIQPFITPLLTSFIIAYVFYPLYKGMDRYIKNTNVRAFVVSIFVIAIISIPLVITFNLISKETSVLLVVTQQKLARGDVFGLDCEETGWICTSIKNNDYYIRSIYYLNENVDNFKSWVNSATTEFLFSIPRRIVDLVITLFVTFYLFKDGKLMLSKLRSLVELKERHEKPLSKQLGDIMYAVIYGTLIIALVQAFFGAIAFYAIDWIFGVKIASPILWGIVIGILALIPFIGGSVVWGVATIYLLATGEVAAALFFAVFNMIFVSGVDLFVKPRVIGTKADVHPVLVIIGVIGGIFVFGFIGFIVGPVVFAIMGTLINIYQQERQWKS